MSIPFNIPYLSGHEMAYIQEVITKGEYSGGNTFNKLCEHELQKITTSDLLRLPIYASLEQQEVISHRVLNFLKKIILPRELN